MPNVYDQCSHVVVLVAGDKTGEQRQAESECGGRFHGAK